MSNYTKATNFATKDGLTTGDPAKVVKGTEIDTEFNAISSAIASKSDSNSPTFTGTPVAPTASSGTNTTQIATTAFVAAASSGVVSTERTATATLTNKTISADNNTLSGIAASSFVLSDASGNIDGSAAQKAIPSGAVVGTTDSQTLTNKTINGSQLVDGSVTASKLVGAQTGSAPIYGARAWVNFNGIGTVAINASGNVSSVTDNGTGDYTINFTTAMPDANYSACGFGVGTDVTNVAIGAALAFYPTGTATYLPATKTTGASRIIIGQSNAAILHDVGNISFNVFR